MQLKRVSGIGIAAACLALLCACGSGSPGGPGNNGEAVASLTIPAAGGTIEADLGISVVAPAGAVTSDTPITISLKAPAGSGTVGLGAFPSAAECGPTGTTFASPIEIRIPVDKAPASTDCALFSREGPGGAWTQLDQDGGYDAAGKYISLKTTHFSVIAYSDIPAPGLRVFADEFPGEFAMDKSCDGAMTKLRDLFVGKNGIMGVEQKVGDDTYKVCGVDIDVQYKYDSEEYQHVGDMTGEKTNDYTSLTFFHDDSTSDMTIISYTSVLIFWKKVVREQYLVTYNFTGVGGAMYALNGYSSTMHFTIDVSAEDNAPVNILEEEDAVFDAYFNQTAPASIVPDSSEAYVKNIRCPATGNLMVLIGGATYPGTCLVGLWVDEPDEYFVTGEVWGRDEDGDRNLNLDPDFFLIGTTREEDAATLPIVLQDGYTGSGQTEMLGFGLANLSYTVSVRKLR